MLRRHAAAPDLEVLDEEGHRELVELVDDERVGEHPPEGHQVVGGEEPVIEQRHVAADYPPVPLRLPRSSPSVARHEDSTQPARSPPRLRRRRQPAGDERRRRAAGDHLRLGRARRGRGRPAAAGAGSTTPRRGRQAGDPASPRRPRGSPTRCTCTSTEPARSGSPARSPGRATAPPVRRGLSYSRRQVAVHVRISGTSRRRRRSRSRWGCRS